MDAQKAQSMRSDTQLAAVPVQSILQQLLQQMETQPIATLHANSKNLDDLRTSRTLLAAALSLQQLHPRPPCSQNLLGNREALVLVASGGDAEKV
jgi:hypothetical protein